MIFKICYLLILSIFCQNVSSFPVDEYFDNSILKAIKKDQLSFISDINLQSDIEFLANIKEKYSFKSSTGEFVGKEWIESRGKNVTGKILFIENLKELYQIDYDKKKCERLNGKDDRLIFFFLDNWLPNEMFAKPDKDIILGPSFILFFLLDEYEKDNRNVKCERVNGMPERINPKKCVLSFKKMKVDYYFEDKNGYTMSPFKIEVFNEAHNDWQLSKKFDYLNFEADHNEEPMASHYLPIGYACERPFDRNLNNYPTVSRNYGNFIRLEYDVEFEYNKDTSTPTIKRYSNILNLEEWPERIGANDGMHEKSGKPIRTIYKKGTDVYYNIEGDQCTRHDRKMENKTINWYYVQDLFVNHPEFFYVDGFYYEHKIYAENNYTYLGEYMVGDEMTKVYERSFTGFNERNSADSDNSGRENVNNVYSDYIIATHYFPLHKTHWPNNDENFEVPLKIELRLRGEDRTTDIAKLTLNINYFGTQAEKNLFDLTKCISYAPSFDNVTITFKGPADQVKKLKGQTQRINRQLKAALYYIPALSIADLSEDVEGTLMHVNFKLLASPDIDNHFDIKDHEAFEENLYNSVDVGLNEYGKCIKLCAENSDCGAFAHKSSSNECKIWIKYKDDREFDWSKFKTVRDSESRVGRKKINSNELLTNEKLLGYIRENIEDKHPMSIYFYDADYGVVGFEGIDLKVNSKNN